MAAEYELLTLCVRYGIILLHIKERVFNKLVESLIMKFFIPATSRVESGNAEREVLRNTRGF